MYSCFPTCAENVSCLWEEVGNLVEKAWERKRPLCVLLVLEVHEGIDLSFKKLKSPSYPVAKLKVPSEEGEFQHDAFG